MLSGIMAAWRGLRHVEHRGYLYVWANVCALLMTVLVITAPAAWAGINKMSYMAYRSRLTTLNDFWDGVRENLLRGVVLFIANFIIVELNIFNILLYGGNTSIVAIVLWTVSIITLLVWFSIQLYLWPLFYQMQTPTLRGALKNALVMAYLNPLFTLGLWIIILPILVISTLLGPLWFLLTISILASISNAAVIDRLEAAGFTVEHLPE